MEKRTQNDNLFSAADRFTQKGVFSAEFHSHCKACCFDRAQAYCSTSSIEPSCVTKQANEITATKRIELTFGKWAIIDAADYYRVKDFKWCAVQKGPTFYAKTLRTNGSHLSLHRLITNAPKHLVVDHINHNGLDNRRSNLRLCTPAQNQQNKRPQAGGTSRHKGVHWDKKRKKYIAQIGHKSKRYTIGRFDNEDDAGRAYDKKAKELFGEYACLNFP